MTEMDEPLRHALEFRFPPDRAVQRRQRGEIAADDCWSTTTTTGRMAPRPTCRRLYSNPACSTG